MTAYLVPARAGTALVEDRRSTFLATVVRVEGEAAARAVVEGARKEHWDARHHCSAFVLGPRGEVARSSDDGEPAGTAGAPMLAVLRGAEVSDVVAVVTRWFGGVLLGAGGLVRAYSHAVRAALDDAGVVERTRVELVAVSIPHALAGRLENDLRSRGIVVREVTYAEDARLVLAVPADLAVAPLAASLTGGVALLEPAGTTWVDSPLP